MLAQLEQPLRMPKPHIRLHCIDKGFVNMWRAQWGPILTDDCCSARAAISELDWRVRRLTDA